MVGTKTEAFVNRFREARGPEWVVTIAGRYEPYVVGGYHRLGKDVPAVNVWLCPYSHALVVRLFHGDEEESFTDIEAAYQYVEELLKDLSVEAATEEN